MEAEAKQREDGGLCIGRGVVGGLKIKETGSENTSTEIGTRGTKAERRMDEC